ncbi:MAG: DUF3822 family protein [Bacteroidia bacterium]
MMPAPYHVVEYVRNPIKVSLMATCRLVFFIQPNRASYLIISPKEEIIHCKEFRNTEVVSQSVFLRFILEKEPILSSTFLDSRVYISEVPFTLIPDVFWRDDYQVPLSRLLLQDVFDKSEVTSISVPSLPGRLLFPLPSMTLNFLNQYIPHHTLTHVSALLLSISDRLSKEYDHLILTLILEKQLLIAAIVEGELKICNRFPFQTHNDAAYFIQTVKNVTGVLDKDLPHFVLGEIEAKSDTKQSLWDFFPHMQFPEFMRPIIHNENESVPWWRFAFLNP